MWEVGRHQADAETQSRVWLDKFPRQLPGAVKPARQNPSEGLLRRCWTPRPGSDSAGLGWDLRVCLSNALRWADAAGSPWKNLERFGGILRSLLIVAEEMSQFCLNLKGQDDF